jgi:restriction system protein
VRDVEWEGKIRRDKLSVNSRNSLGSVLTLFSVNEETWGEIKSLLNAPELPFTGNEQQSPNESKEDLKEGFILTRDELREKSHELIKDKIVSLSDEDLEELAAALLRSMGLRARVSPKGYDRGVDVFASPDGLGLKEPRIKVEVKHRQNTAIGSQDLRSFISVLRQGDKGLYISTGGFTKDAKYEADRSNQPITLLDLYELANLVVTHYENFDVEGRTMLSLTKVYLPNE